MLNIADQCMRHGGGLSVSLPNSSESSLRDWSAKWRLVRSYLNDEEYDEHCFGDRLVTRRGRATASTKFEPLDEILWSMEPGSYKSKCPCHEDNEASLSVLITEEKKVLVNCFAGCDWREVQGYVKAHA